MPRKIYLLLSPFLLLPLYGFGVRFIHILGMVKAASLLKPGFYPTFLISICVAFFFVSQSSYFSILRHELIHNLFAILTFQKPQGLVVKKGEGGQFSFSGRGNMLITLSPYFFPMLSFFWMPVSALSLSNKTAFHIILGILLGFEIIMSLKDIHIHQTDFKPFGLVFSILFISVASLICWGCVIAFVQNGLHGMANYLQGGAMGTFGFIATLVKSINKG